MYTSLNRERILNPSDMAKKIIAKPLRRKAQRELEKSEQYIRRYPDCIHKLFLLESRLKEFIPNSSIKYSLDEYIDLELARGEFMYGDRARLEIGRPNQCHKNSAELFELNPETTRIVTGWAFIQQDLWVQHSWLIHYLTEDYKKYELVETTLKRDAYFGVVLTPEECYEFIDYIYS